MSKDVPTFAGLISQTIEERYASDSDFARQVGVSPSAVSRWVSGQSVPSVATLEKLAPHLNLAASTLVAIAYPSTASQVALPDLPAPPHPLARELERMLADDSPVPDDERTILTTLVDRIIDPYRRHLRRRRAA